MVMVFMTTGTYTSSPSVTSTDATGFFPKESPVTPYVTDIPKMTASCTTTSTCTGTAAYSRVPRSISIEHTPTQTNVSALSPALAADKQYLYAVFAALSSAHTSLPKACAALSDAHTAMLDPSAPVSRASAAVSRAISPLSNAYSALSQAYTALSSTAPVVKEAHDNLYQTYISLTNVYNELVIAFSAFHKAAGSRSTEDIPASFTCPAFSVALDRLSKAAAIIDIPLTKTPMHVGFVTTTATGTFSQTTTNSIARTSSGSETSTETPPLSASHTVTGSTSRTHSHVPAPTTLVTATQTATPTSTATVTPDFTLTTTHMNAGLITTTATGVFSWTSTNSVKHLRGTATPTTSAAAQRQVKGIVQTPTALSPRTVTPSLTCTCRTVTQGPHTSTPTPAPSHTATSTWWLGQVPTASVAPVPVATLSASSTASSSASLGSLYVAVDGPADVHVTLYEVGYEPWNWTYRITNLHAVPQPISISAGHDLFVTEYNGSNSIAPNATLTAVVRLHVPTTPLAPQTFTTNLTVCQNTDGCVPVHQHQVIVSVLPEPWLTSGGSRKGAYDTCRMLHRLNKAFRVLSAPAARLLAYVHVEGLIPIPRGELTGKKR